MTDLGNDVQALAGEFDRKGFLKITDALPSDRISSLNAAVDRFRRDHPEQWAELSDSLLQTPNVLPWTSDFDFVIENPKALNILRNLIGEDVTFEEFGIMIRNPTENLAEFKGWHRDLTRDYSRRLEIDAISVVYYLTDVSENDHCLSVVPETHNRLVDLRPEEVGPDDGFDITGPAGTAVMFHARCIHAGKLKANSRPRRTLHVYYSRSALPRTNEWTEIPERLYRKVDPVLPPRLYSKRNVSEVFDGTGRKPKNVDPSAPISELVKEAQRIAKEGARKA